MPAGPGTGITTPPAFGAGSVPFDAGARAGGKKADDEAIVGSPLKKARASLSGLDGEIMGRRLGLGQEQGQGPGQGLGLGLAMGGGLSGPVGGGNVYGDGTVGVKREEADEEL